MSYSNPGPAIGGTPTTWGDSAGFPDGLNIGNTSTALVGFWGATATTQPAAVTSVATTAITTVITTAATSTTPYGFATSGQANAIVAAVNSLIAAQASNVTQANAINAALTAIGILA